MKFLRMSASEHDQATTDNCTIPARIPFPAHNISIVYTEFPSKPMFRYAAVSNSTNSVSAAEQSCQPLQDLKGYVRLADLARGLCHPLDRNLTASAPSASYPLSADRNQQALLFPGGSERIVIIESGSDCCDGLVAATFWACGPNVPYRPLDMTGT